MTKKFAGIAAESVRTAPHNSNVNSKGRELAHWSIHCVKYRNFTQFSGVDILWKGTVHAEFCVNCGDHRDLRSMMNIEMRDGDAF